MKRTIRVAVTSAGSAPAVAVIKALRAQRDLDIHITACDMDPLSSGFYLSDKKVLIPGCADSKFADILTALCRKDKIRFLIPIIDEELIIFARNRAKFALPATTVIANNPRTILNAKNKFTAWQTCARNNIAAPSTIRIEDLPDTRRLHFPLILKPIAGRGSIGIVKIDNQDELDFALAKERGGIIQEFVQGPEYTIDIVADPQGNILQAVPRERVMVKAGMSYKGKTVKDAQLMAFGARAARAFGVNGPANVQCIRSNKGIYLIEVNPKFSAGLPLTVAAGVNIPLILLKLALGIRVAPRELNFTDGLYMLRYWEEIFVPQKKSRRQHFC